MLTDRQILNCFTHGLSDSNGRRCGRRLTENGVASTSHPCLGEAKIVKGKVILIDTCGEPCSFICDNARSFQNKVETLLSYEKIIELSKKEFP